MWLTLSRDVDARSSSVVCEARGRAVAEVGD